MAHPHNRPIITKLTQKRVKRNRIHFGELEISKQLKTYSWFTQHIHGLLISDNCIDVFLQKQFQNGIKLL